MIPFDLRDFINLMSLIIFGGVAVSCLFAFVAYALAIDRRRRAKQPVETESATESEAVFGRPPGDS